MEDAKALEARAEEQLDKGDYSRAKELYRMAVELFPPTVSTTANLSLAEDLERLQFRQHVKMLFPENLHIIWSEIALLEAAGYYERLFELYTNLLTQSLVAPSDKLNFRLNRLRLMCRHGKDDDIRNEFLEIWREIEGFPSNIHILWVSLLKILSTELQHEKATPILEQLEAEANLPDNARAYIKAQILGIKHLAAFRETL